MFPCDRDHEVRPFAALSFCVDVVLLLYPARSLALHSLHRIEFDRLSFASSGSSHYAGAVPKLFSRLICFHSWTLPENRLFGAETRVRVDRSTHRQRDEARESRVPLSHPNPAPPPTLFSVFPQACFSARPSSFEHNVHVLCKPSLPKATSYPSAYGVVTGQRSAYIPEHVLRQADRSKNEVSTA